jgi:hypothetical protein
MPLHSNSSFSIVACVFITAGTSLLNRCLALNVHSVSTIPAFRHLVTIFYQLCAGRAVPSGPYGQAAVLCHM